MKKINWLRCSLGTLGGGNHFIEVDAASDETNYLVIHGGSRNHGKQVAELYQQMAVDLHKGVGVYHETREEIIRTYNEQGRNNEIQKALKELKDKREMEEADMLEDLCYLSGEPF